MKILNYKFLAVMVLFLSAIQVSFVSCSDDPGVTNRFTSTSQYASDFLKDREQFSDYVKILQKATGESGNLRVLDLLGTYGSYTVFAPTNDAVAAYLKEHGVSTVEELSKEDCDTIALNSIIEQEFFISDFSQGTYPKANMLDRFLKIDTTGDTINGEVVMKCLINNSSLITHADDSVSNGVVHTIGSIVGTSNDLLPDVLSKDSTISFFYEALVATGLDQKYTAYIDESYSVGSDSVGWTNNALVMHTAVEYDNVAYMEHRYFKYTAFVEPNEVYEAKGIKTLDDLIAKAHELYDPMYPDDVDVTDLKDERNALNRYIAYHFLPFQGLYYTLTCVDGDDADQNTSPSITKCFARRKIDISDWYETCMSHSIMKFSFPSGTQKGLYINRRGVQSRPDERGVFVRGAKISEQENNAALNGVYHYIDDIIAYDEQTQKVVLNERMRLDTSTLSPDFITSGARGHRARNGAGDKGGKYAPGGQGSNALTNNATCLGFKAGAATNFFFDDKTTHIHIRPRVINYWSFEGDEMTIKGRFDLTLKLPPVPAGEYELRFFTCVDFASRGIMQAYEGTDPENLRACGIPFDMRPNGTILFNNTSDSNLGDDDAIQSFDKSIHNNGWMKGPGSYCSGSGGWSDINNSFRNFNTTIRKVITRFHTDGKEDHYLRIQQKMESSENEMNFDFIEIVPSTVFNSEYYPEDRW